MRPSRGYRPGTSLDTARWWTSDGEPSRQRRAATRVRSRGLPSQRRMARKCGIMTKAIRRPLVVRGVGERPAQSSLTSPVCVLPNSSPLSPSPALPINAHKKAHRDLALHQRCPVDTGSASALTRPLSHGLVLLRSGIRDTAGWAYLTRDRGTKHAFSFGNKKTSCVGCGRSRLCISATPGWLLLCSFIP